MFALRDSLSIARAAKTCRPSPEDTCRFDHHREVTIAREAIHEPIADDAGAYICQSRGRPVVAAPLAFRGC